MVFVMGGEHMGGALLPPPAPSHDTLMTLYHVWGSMWGGGAHGGGEHGGSMGEQVLP